MTRLHDLILAQAHRTPDAVAVRDERREVTFSQLVAEAQGVADRLRAAGAGADAVVAVCADRSVDLVAALVGILLADAAYLPIDATHPASRLEYMFAEARPIAVLADPAGHERLGRISPAPVTGLDATGLPASTERPGPAGGQSLAYVIYTSGSTGRPKGVAVPHQGIVNRLLWMQEYLNLTPADVVLQKTPYTFDVSVWEFFWPLITGARLVMAAPDGHRDPEYLVEVIQREGVTTMHFVPSMLESFVREEGLAECPSLRRVIASGEALTPALANRFAAAHPAELHNLYGPTEASVDVTAWRCRRPESGRSVPIGYPITGVSCYVVRPDNTLCDPGESGELLLGGVCLARGYLGQPELTAERFVTGPVDGERVYRTGDIAQWHPDGYLEYVGRADHQVKLRGFRIELGEIEAVLAAHAEVTQATVVLRDLGPMGPRLVAYVSTEVGGTAGDLVSYASAQLPDYMVPSYFVRLDGFPVTSNGKVDRAALPQPSREHLASSWAKAASMAPTR
ncbi:amino acid adenylation domain-containing protein [Micromonospora haikouensis]|uniref:amino acid adenylation domain-containing protein n=1 Tax=Micromonospora haikouensis TaxID=686309 RepID=UPI003D721DA7